MNSARLGNTYARKVVVAVVLEAAVAAAMVQAALVASRARRVVAHA